MLSFSFQERRHKLVIGGLERIASANYQSRTILLMKSIRWYANWIVSDRNRIDRAFSRHLRLHRMILVPVLNANLRAKNSMLSRTKKAGAHPA